MFPRLERPVISSRGQMVSLNPHLLHYYLIPRSKDTFFSEPFYLEGLKRRRMDGCENLFTTGAVVEWVRFERFS